MFNDFYHPGAARDERLRGFGCFARLSGLECMLITIKNMCRALCFLALLRTLAVHAKRLLQKPRLMKTLLNHRNAVSTKPIHFIR